MTTETNQTQTATGSVDAEQNAGLTLEQALEEITKLRANYHDAVQSRDETKQKLRKLEQDASGASDLTKKYEELMADKSKLHEQFEAVNGELTSLKNAAKDQTVSQALTTALEASGAKSVSTVLKLIDKSKIQFDEQGQVVADSVVALIKEVQESDPILFGGDQGAKKSEQTQQSSTGSPSVPAVKRAGEDSTEGAFDKEIKAAKSQREIEAVLRKYGKL